MSFLSSLSIIHGLGACSLILYIHFFINLQLPQQYIRWPVSPDRIAGSGIDPSS